MTSNVGLKGLRGTLEAALESDDLSPLLKLVCSAPARQTTEATEDFGPSPNTPSPAARRDEYLPIAEGTLNAVVQTLQGIGERRDLELKRVFQGNATDISSALSELGSVQSTSTDLRRRAQETAASMQRMNVHFSSRMDALNEALVVQERVQQARATLAAAKQILSLLEEAAASIQSGQYYHARKSLTEVKSRYAGPLKAAAGGLDLANYASAPAAHLGTLSSHLLSRLSQLEASLDAKLASDLNEWLTEARSKAGEVGKRAVEMVQREQKERAALAQKKSLVLQSALSRDDPAVDEIVNRIKQLDIENPAETEAIEDPAAALDTTLMLRCVHVHSLDHTLPQLLESYVEARQAQLGADLAPPSDLLQRHQAFLWQIVGFFVIEMRVAVLAPQLGTAAHAEASWEGASAALAAELGAAIDEANKAEDIRALKANALRACDAVDRYCKEALSTRGIRKTLANRMGKHRSMLANTISAALLGDSMQGEDVAAAVHAVVEAVALDCKEYVIGLVEPHDVPAATFAECDKVLAEAVSSRVAAFIAEEDDISEYYDEESDGSEFSEEEEASEGASVYSSSEDSEGEYSSNSGSEGTEDGEEVDVESERSGDEERNEEEEEEDAEEFMELLRLVTVAALAEKALQSLGTELKLGTTVASVQSSSASSLLSPSSTAATQLNGALLATEDAAGRRIAYGAEDAVDALADLDWTPTSMPRTAGAITEECTEMIEILDLGWKATDAMGVPLESQKRILGTAIQRIGESIMRLLASDAVPYFNVYGVQRLLNDLEGITKYAERVTGNGNEATSWLEEPIQFCEIIAFHTAKELLNAEKRANKYGSLNIERCVELLEKVKDPGVPTSSTAGRLLGRNEALKIATELKVLLAAERGGS